MTKEELKQRLIELLEQCSCPYSPPCTSECHECNKVEMYDKEIANIADHLIANGVTLAEDNNVLSKWIPVTERLPDKDGCEYCKEDNEGYRKMFGAFSITNPFHGNEWFINTGHCKPRQICFCPMCGRRLPVQPETEKGGVKDERC